MATDVRQDEPAEGELVDTRLDGSAAMMALTKSEIDQQIATAKRYPRSVTQFKRDTKALACMDEETAATMFYALPRAGKKIEGPSVRMAEVVASCWGNIRTGARVVAVDDEFVTAQGACFDLEKNNSASIEIKRRITDKHGKRFNADMIQTTGNAACAIALREAVFKVVPRAMFWDIYKEAKLTSIGKAESMGGRRQRAMEWFLKAGATQEQVLQAVERTGIDDLTIDDLITLNGLRTAIKDGDSTIEDALGPRPDLSAKVRKSELNEKLASVSKSAESKTEKPNFKEEAYAPTETSIDVKLSECKTIADVLAARQECLDHFGADVPAWVQPACDKRLAELSVAKGKQGQLVS